MRMSSENAKGDNVRASENIKSGKSTEPKVVKLTAGGDSKTNKCISPKETPSTQDMNQNLNKESGSVRKENTVTQNGADSGGKTAGANIKEITATGDE